MDACTRDRHERLKERVRFLARKFARSAVLSSQLESLARQLEPASLPVMTEVASRLRELCDISPKLRDAMEEYEHQASVDRAEGFLGDLAEDRSSAPAEIVPLIDHYFARLREVISNSWDRQITRRELDAHVLQVRLSYSQDLDRILQGLLPSSSP
ncbi:MAG TPA: hypothetical protein VNM14_24535 [Planctomycetota bacterium]|nr:hypothetical protein [Planctomycetota bacterium]